MNMNKFSSALTAVARPVVKTALEAELMDVGSTAWMDEAKLALGTLLADDQVMRSFDSSPPVLQALQKTLENPLPPKDDEIDERAKEVGRVMASAWLQFITFALEAKPTLELRDNLLPAQSDVSEELWDALLGSLNGLPVGIDGVQRIMHDFADQHVTKAMTIDLPMHIVIVAKHGNRSPYLARRS